MTIAQELDSQEGICQDVIFPPGDLYSDEPPLESELHLRQIILFLQCLEWLWRDRNDFYAAGNLTVYYSPHQRKSEFFRGPDFFVVLGTERKTRKSWVVWEEDGKYPNVIVEILSDSTANTDRGLKKTIYQDTFRTPDYFWFDPYTQEFAGFHLVDGEYQPLQASEQGYLWSQQLGLYLGAYQGLLRFFTRDGQLVPTPEETADQIQQQVEQAEQKAEQAEQKAEQAEQKAEQAEQKAEQAEQQAERLAGKLRELNIDPDTI
ncbi:Uma2 family endonuclease [Nostoc flagelliforme FACHB-838]|uniref:Uma2 family endonuclease n=1 Tax=Nostoc flagelliforme FACHB-838 TaxID=2692904 RepID=A0ABR8DJA3_9NOSO|nr:Uma2 family endonuclease [Nostoc flagelliforme]MBD2528614.1 Uma2 family endonuclease [Nostoc flagelliforme FACHB-838]